MSAEGVYTTDISTCGNPSGSWRGAAFKNLLETILSSLRAAPVLVASVVPCAIIVIGNHISHNLIEASLSQLACIGGAATIVYAIICTNRLSHSIAYLESRRAKSIDSAIAVSISFGVVSICYDFGTDGRANLLIIAWGVASVLATAMLEAYQRGPRLVIIGSVGEGGDLARRMLGLVSGRGASMLALDINNPRDVGRLAEMASRDLVDIVVVPSTTGDACLEQICKMLSDTAARVCVDLPESRLKCSPFPAHQNRRDSRFPVLDVLPPPFIGWRRRIKRLFDLIFVALLIPFLMPVLVLIACAIRLDTRGPILFRQWRFGERGRPFLVYKFRTMRIDQCDPTGAKRTAATDPRVTRVGRILRRLSLDELPQLINVIHGGMSLVGPRPHPIQMQIGGRLYHRTIADYGARHRMPPGITGWAQVNGSRGAVDTIEKGQRRVDLDLYYIGNWSIYLDMLILCRTILGGFMTLNSD